MTGKRCFSLPANAPTELFITSENTTGGKTWDHAPLALISSPRGHLPAEHVEEVMSVSEVPPSCCGSQVQPGLLKPMSGAWSSHPSPWLYSLDVGTILYTQLEYFGAGNMENGFIAPVNDSCGWTLG